MKQSFKIEIPKPCYENWDKMTSQKDGKHCASCNKVVVDFTKMTDEEIKNYFTKNKFGKTCGHFNKHQLEKSSDSFRKKLYNAYDNAHKIKSTVLRFSSLCVLSIALFLLGCSQPMTGKVECAKPEKLTGDSIVVEHTLGMPMKVSPSGRNSHKIDSSVLKKKKEN